MGLGEVDAGAVRDVHRDGPPRGWFDAVARFLGPAYLRNAFTQGTEQEVDFLVGSCGLEPGMRVLDVGSGPGRHSIALARRGIEVVGVDRSREFVTLANAAAGADALPARFVVGDVRTLPVAASFDALVCLCQGGFGLLGGHDEIAAFTEMVSRVRPGGAIAVSVVSAAFAVRFLEEGEEFDVASGVLHERATARDEHGAEADFDLWSTCFTARELRLLAMRANVEVEALYGVAPGRYGAHDPRVEDPELLLLGRRAAMGFQIARVEQ